MEKLENSSLVREYGVCQHRITLLLWVHFAARNSHGSHFNLLLCDQLQVFRPVTMQLVTGTRLTIQRFNIYFIYNEIQSLP